MRRAVSTGAVVPNAGFLLGNSVNIFNGTLSVFSLMTAPATGLAGWRRYQTLGPWNNLLELPLESPLWLISNAFQPSLVETFQSQAVDSFLRGGLPESLGAFGKVLGVAGTFGDVTTLVNPGGSSLAKNWVNPGMALAAIGGRAADLGMINAGG